MSAKNKKFFVNIQGLRGEAEESQTPVNQTWLFLKN